MNKLTCEICGGKTIVKDAEHFRCAGCGACYTAQQLREKAEPPKCTPQGQQKEKAEPPKGAAVWQHKGKIVTALCIVAAVALLLAFALLNLSALRVFPDKSQAKESAGSQMKTSISNEYVTLKKLKIEDVEAQGFKTREDDPVGYFDYLEKGLPITDQYGTKYETPLAYYNDWYGTDFSQDTRFKWAYTLTGTYQAVHKEHGDIEGEFRIVYVDNGSAWCLVDEQHWCSEDVLRQEVKSQIMARLLTSYKLQGVPTVEITLIEKEQQNNYYMYYTVYGTVTAKNQYGETYEGKFTAKYACNEYDQVLEEKSIELSELIKTR